MATIVDYAGRPPGAAAIKAAGHIGAIRYVAGDRTKGSLPGKPITRAEVDDFRAHGLALAFVWQYGKDSAGAPPDVLRGRAGGVADARAAQARLDEIGAPHHPVFFAVDFDITLTQWNSTAAHYFRGAAEVLGVQRVGIYGHSRVCHWAGPENGVIGRSGDKWLAWQTRSWSHGVLGDRYCVLYQRIVDTAATPGPRIGGTVVDVNDVWADDWGQRPRPPAAPAPPKEVPPMTIRPNPGHRGDPLFLPDLLRAWGVRVEEFGGWRGRGQGDFSAIWGTMAHHTGDNNTPVSIIAYGHSALRGLLSQIHLARNGVATMCGAGHAYHAGVGSWPGIATNAANQVTIGIEAVSNGTTPWPREQYEAYVRICAAISWYLGHSSLRVIGHKEWGAVQGKWDPGGIDMNAFRRDVQHLIDNPPFMPREDTVMSADFWLREPVTSLVDGKTTMTRDRRAAFTDYHACKANEQSGKAVDELGLLRDDVSALTDLVGDLTKVVQQLATKGN